MAGRLPLERLRSFDMTSTPIDQELVTRAAGGSLGAWTEIYERTRARLFGFLSFQSGDRDEALELLQETYLAAMKGIRNFRGDGSLESWLLGIAVRRMRRWTRRCSRWRRRFESAGNPDQFEAASDPSMALVGRRLRSALSTLSESQRTALLLHVWLELPYAEIAAIMKIRESTARAHAHRAKDFLRIRLGPEILDGPAPCAQETLS